MEPANVNLKDPKYLPIDPNNMDPRLFTPEYMRMFGGYGALSQIKPQDYNNNTDVFERAVGSAPDAAISASSTLFNYLTVTPGFTKVSSLNYQVYRDAKIQMYTPVRYCDKGAVNDGKVVLDSRGIIASMTPVSEKELPTAKQFELYQLIGDEENKRVNLVPDSDDEVGDVAKVKDIGVYNPNFLFFVKVSDVTPEKMTLAKSMMTGRTGLKNQEEKKLNEKKDLIKMKQESEEKDQATSAQQKEKQEAITNALKSWFMYDITDLLRDDRSVNFLNDALTMYDIYESPLVGGGDKTFVGSFSYIDVTCEGAISSFKLTLNVTNLVGSTAKSLLVGSTELTFGYLARVVDTTNTKYWVNVMKKNDSDHKSPDYLKKYAIFERMSVDELNSNIIAKRELPLTSSLNDYKKKMKRFDEVVSAKINTPFFKKIEKDDSKIVYASYVGSDCYGYEIGVLDKSPIYMGKLQSVNGNNVTFKKRYKSIFKKTNDSCDSDYSLEKYEIYIFGMPEDPITKYMVSLKRTADINIDKMMELATISAGIKEKQKLTTLPSYVKLKAFLAGSMYDHHVKTAFDAMFFKKNDFYEQFISADYVIIDGFDLLCNQSDSVRQFIKEMRIESLNPPNAKPSVVKQTVAQPSPTVVPQPVDDVIRVGDAIRFKAGFGCNGKIYKYAFVVNVTKNPSNSMTYGLFTIQNLDFFKYAKSQIENKQQLNVKCTVLDQVIDKKVPINEVEEYFNANPSTIGGGAKHTRRSHTGLRKNVTRHGKHGLNHRRTSHKGRKRLAYSKTAKK